MTLATKLAHAATPWVAALVGVTLSMAALAVPASVDDHYHRAVLRPGGAVPDAASHLGMFSFIDDDVTRTERLASRGVFPWWLGERTRISFFRPLTEATHRLDFALWPESRVAMHLHDLAWAFLALAAVGLLHRRMFGARPVAGLAALVYALDDAHGLPFGWTANRNAVLATLFGAIAIAAHDRWRREDHRASAPLSIVALALALLSAEAGIGALAYLVAHALTLDPAPWPRRLRALTPALVLVAAWRGLSSALGHGVVGSALYVDPWRSPARFATVLVLRAPVLLAGAWGPLPSDLDGLVPERARALEALLCLVALLAVLTVLAPQLRRDPLARFFALGMTLALVPVSATFPSDRLLFFVGIGSSALVARAIELATRPQAWRVRALGTTLALVHLGLAPLALPVRAYSPALVARYLEPCTHAPAGSEGRHLILVNALDACPAYLPLRSALDGRETPASTFTIAPGVATMHLTRRDERTLDVTRDGGWFTTTNERAFWDPERPWHVGDERAFGAGRVRVVAVTDDARPLTVSLRFDVPLDDASLIWRRVDDDGVLSPLTLPAAGHTLVLDPILP